MTVSAPNLISGPYTPDGVVTTFPFLFPVLDSGEVTVFSRLGNVDTVMAGYTVSGLGNASGSIVFSVAPLGAIGQIWIVGAPSFEQDVVFENQGPFLPAAHNEANDRAALRDIYLRDQLNRTVLVPVGQTGFTLPVDPTQRENKIVGTGADGSFGLLSGQDFKGDPGGNTNDIGPFQTFGTVTISLSLNRVFTSGWMSGADGGAGAYRRVAAGPTTSYRAQDAGGHWWELDETIPFSRQFGCLQSVGVDDTAHIGHMRDYSILTGRKCFFSPTTAAAGHVLVGELRMDSGAAGLDGAALAGFGPNRSYVRVRPASTTQPVFSFYGGSGDTSNKSLEDLTIIADTGYEGKGQGIYLDGQCFTTVDNVQCTNLNTMLSLNNNSGGSFTESNKLTRLRGHNCFKIVAFGINGGGDSFRDNQIQARGEPSNGGYGLYSKGITDDCFIYECRIDMNIDGGNGGVTLMYIEKTFGSDNKGLITGEQVMVMNARADGQWNGCDVLSTYDLTWTIAAGGSFDFDSCNANNISTSGYGTFADARLDTLTPGYFGDLVNRSQTSTRAPSAFPILGGAEKSVGFSAYLNSWFYFFKAPFNGAMKDLVPGVRISSEGGVIETMAGAGLDIREYGVTGQLLLGNGRVGGKFGRNNPKGVAQAPLAVPSSGTYTLATGADRHTIQLAHVRIAQSLDAGTNVDVNFVLAWRVTGFGGPGSVKSIAVNVGDAHDYLDALNTSGGAYTTTVIGDFSVDSSGNLKVAIVTTEALIIEYHDLSLGTTHTN